MLEAACRARSPSRSWSALSPKQVWCRVRGTWDCRCEHAARIRCCSTGSLPGGLLLLSARGKEETVEQIHDRLPRLDVHPHSVAGCVRVTGPRGGVSSEKKPFATT